MEKTEISPTRNARLEGISQLRHRSWQWCLQARLIPRAVSPLLVDALPVARPLSLKL
jgi:hypothetical protein